jgi:hypothetical protein
VPHGSPHLHAWIAAPLRARETFSPALAPMMNCNNCIQFFLQWYHRRIGIFRAGMMW